MLMHITIRTIKGKRIIAMSAEFATRADALDHASLIRDRMGYAMTTARISIR